MNCPSCRKENTSGVKFCKHCGAPMNEKHKTCKNGHNYDATLSECPYCPKGNFANTVLEEGSPTFTGTSKSEIADKTVVERQGKQLIKGDKTMIDRSGATLTNQSSSGRNDKTVILSPEDNSASSQRKGIKGEGRKLVGWLVTYDINQYGSDYKICEGRTTIGRSAENDVILNQQGISDQHCLLLYRDKKFYLQDQMSTNGTYVNGTSIEDKITLNDDDQIKIGAITLKLKII